MEQVLAGRHGSIMLPLTMRAVLGSSAVPRRFGRWSYCVVRESSPQWCKGAVVTCISDLSLVSRKLLALSQPSCHSSSLLILLSLSY